MESSSLVERVADLLDTRWRPRLNLTTSERDNLLRWDGSDHDHFEAYPVAVQFPEDRAALWLRHEIRFARRHMIDPSIRVLGVLYDHDTRDHLVFKESFPIDALDVSRRRFNLGLGDCELTQSGARGQLGAGALRWDLTWEPRRLSTRPLLFAPLYELGAIPSKVLLPNDNVPVWGEVTARGRVIRAGEAPAQQAHLWGRRSPLRWMWARVSAFAHRPDASLEAALVQELIGDQPSPWILLIRMVYKYKPYVFVRLLGDLGRAGDRYSLDGWRFSVGRGDLHFSGKIQVKPADFVGARLEDPDGRERFLHTAAAATTRVEVSRRHGLRFKSEVELEATEQTWFEIAAPEADPRVQIAL